MNTFDNKAYFPRSPITVFQALLALIFVLTFALSLVIAPFHVEGDQVHYSQAYTVIAGLGFEEALLVYKTIIYTEEPVHFFIIWIFSSLGVEKNLFMASANSLLAVLFAKFLREKGASLLMVVWITFSAYYLHTMFFTLERTKFAFIFMLIYLLSQQRKWILVAVFTHTLTLIPLALNIIGQKLFRPKSKRQMDMSASNLPKIFKITVAVAFLLLLFEGLSVHLHDKFFAYYSENQNNDYFEGWSLLFLCGVTLMTARDRRITLLFYLGLLLSAVLMGSSRINMIGYFAFLYFSNFQHQAFKLSVVVMGLYLLFKTWVYLANIYYFGG